MEYTDLKETQVSSKLVFDGKIIKLFHDKIILPNGKTAMREAVKHNGGAAVIAINDKSEVLLIKQFRYCCGCELLEIPAGLIELEGTPEDNAVRELREETGAIASDVKFLTAMYPTPGYTSEKIYIYAAFGYEIANRDLDEDEFINVIKVSLDDAISMIDSGEIIDGKTIIALLMVRNLLNQ